MSDRNATSTYINSAYSYSQTKCDRGLLLLFFDLLLVQGQSIYGTNYNVGKKLLAGAGRSFLSGETTLANF